MYSILLVEDNEDIMRFNASMLKMKGYQIFKAECLEKAREIIEFQDIDLIVLDIMLPDGNGIDFCKEIKKTHDIPVIFVSALGESEDIIAGIRAGGDDYIPKPYDLEVLAVRIEARLRDRKGKHNELYFGNLKLDMNSLTAFIGDRDLLLNQKEFAVLSMLVKNKGKKISKEELFESVWNTSLVDNSSALRTTVSRLKKKLDTENSGIDINSTHAGYLLETNNLN